MSKILIIDDDPDILDALQLICENEGFITETARREKDLHQKLERFHPDVIVLDVLLSGEDGRVICKHLKENEDTKAIKVLMISAHLDARKSVEQVGADDFLEKPFEIENFLQKIDSLITTKPD